MEIIKEVTKVYKYTSDRICGMIKYDLSNHGIILWLFSKGSSAQGMGYKLVTNESYPHFHQYVQIILS